MADTRDTDAPREALRFEADRGASRSFWAAVATLVLIVAWMGSGFVLPAESEAEPERSPQPEPPAVRVADSIAEPVTLTYRAEGQALPDRDTTIRAEASGDVVEVLAEKGADVGRGEVIARLSSARDEADLRTAEEELARAQREFDNATSLLERGVATADRVAEARTVLAGAEAQLTAARQALEDLAIEAPFAGRIETLDLDEGEFVSAGSEVGRIVDNDPLTVAIQVPQQTLNRIRNGQAATVSFITGETREGTVSFVGTSASSETRTFLAEIEVQNDGGAIPAGVSAEVLIPTGEVEAHFVVPSIVSLNESGEIGLKTVEDGQVRFYPVEIARAEVDGIWVTGLPDRAEIITIGQGFVRDGEAVRVQPDAAATGEIARSDPPPLPDEDG